METPDKTMKTTYALALRLRDPFRFKVKTLIAGAQSSRVIEMPDPPATWSVDDVAAVFNLMCSFIRPDGAQFVFACTPVVKKAVRHFIVTITVDEDAAITAPLALQQSVADRMVGRSEAHFVQPKQGRPS